MILVRFALHLREAYNNHWLGVCMNSYQGAQTAQEEFDSTYISSSEICTELKVSRSTLVNARRSGLLPDPIVVNGEQLNLWKSDAVAPYLEAWEIMLRRRRGELIK